MAKAGDSHRTTSSVWRLTLRAVLRCIGNGVPDAQNGAELSRWKWGVVFPAGGASNSCAFRWRHLLILGPPRGSTSICLQGFPGMPRGRQLGTLHPGVPSPLCDACAAGPPAGLTGLTGCDVEGGSHVPARRSRPSNHSVHVTFHLNADCFPLNWKALRGHLVFLMPPGFLPSGLSAYRKGLGFLDS